MQASRTGLDERGRGLLSKRGVRTYRLRAKVCFRARGYLGERRAVMRAAGGRRGPNGSGKGKRRSSESSARRRSVKRGRGPLQYAPSPAFRWRRSSALQSRTAALQGAVARAFRGRATAHPGPVRGGRLPPRRGQLRVFAGKCMGVCAPTWRLPEPARVALLFRRRGWGTPILAARSVCAARTRRMESDRGEQRDGLQRPCVTSALASTSSMFAYPLSAIARSRSARKLRSTSATPSSPPSASPQM
jgi:hypothetical protein